MGTQTTEDFILVVGTRTENGDRLQIKHAERLIRLAERGLAIEKALRSDPGHDVTAAVVEPTQDRTKSVSDWQAMGRALLASTGPFEEGVCRVCGCTETTACSIPLDNGGHTCAWMSGTIETLCSAPDCVAAGLASGMLVRTRCPDCNWKIGHNANCPQNEEGLSDANRSE